MRSPNPQNPATPNLSKAHSAYPSTRFPEVPTALQATFAVQVPLRLRPYGMQPEDLEIDFHQPARPHLETQLLASCTQDNQGAPIDPDFFWRLTVSQRTAALLSLATLAEGPELLFTLTCPHGDCQKPMEVAIALEAIHQRHRQRAAQATASVTIGEQSLRVRQPTGCDQLMWLAETSQDSLTDLQTMVQTLLVNPSVTRESDTSGLDSSEPGGSVFDSSVFESKETLTAALPVLNQALDDLDPLVNFSLLLTCPDCGRPAEQDLDLGGWALGKLQRVQQRLIETVHRLAGHYHWCERDIVALPEWRRARYLSLIERGGS